MTSPGAAPVLTPASVLWLSREGGVAHFPGLVRPRRIHCALCSETQRVELQRLLTALAQACPSDGTPTGADRRLLHLSVEDAAGTVVWALTVAEDAAPEALLKWWRRAGAGPGQGENAGPA